jgi:thymidylate synthase ThyX
MYEAKMILDSICNGQRLTTIQITHPRIIHAEMMTHCAFARNASSSRAIPFKKTVQKVMEDPFIPEHWGINQSGMQAAEELTGERRELAIAKWLEARDEAVRIASEMADADSLNVHKQIVNRLIEPWSWITVCVTGDAAAWSNYFALRCHPDAQPDIQKQAYMAQKEYFTSVPQILQVGQWHSPYIRTEEISDMADWLQNENKSMLAKFNEIPAMVQISTGRCARTSYLTQEGTRDFSEDIKLHDRLRYHTPLHASPFEHVCQAQGNNVRYGKYTGWKAYRHMLEGEYVTDFSPNHLDLINTPTVVGE